MVLAHAMTDAAERAAVTANATAELARLATMFKDMEIITWTLAGIKIYCFYRAHTAQSITFLYVIIFFISLLMMAADGSSIFARKKVRSSWNKLTADKNDATDAAIVGMLLLIRKR